MGTATSIYHFLPCAIYMNVALIFELKDENAFRLIEEKKNKQTV